jgi:hypothetical protein
VRGSPAVLLLLFVEAILDSELTEEADHGAIDQFLVSAYQRAWAEDL